MFKSKLRPIVFPQSEHLRLVGQLAAWWGNRHFELPPVPRRSFIAGVAYHDRGYGPLDNAAIGELDNATWLAITQRGFWMPSSDPVANLISQYHLRRLNRGHIEPQNQALAAQMETAIQAALQTHGWQAETFARIDRITNLCDRISFDFCQEAESQGEVAVFARNTDEKPTPLRYRIRDGVIGVSPWPFAAERYSMLLTAYELAGYPDVLLRLPVEARLEPWAAGGV